MPYCQKGPELQRDMRNVLTHVHHAPVALTSEISEMLLQVELQKEDCRYHQFLWHFKRA